MASSAVGRIVQHAPLGHPPWRWRERILRVRILFALLAISAKRLSTVHILEVWMSGVGLLTATRDGVRVELRRDERWHDGERVSGVDVCAIVVRTHPWWSAS